MGDVASLAVGLHLNAANFKSQLMSAYGSAESQSRQFNRNARADAKKTEDAYKRVSASVSGLAGRLAGFAGAGLSLGTIISTTRQYSQSLSDLQAITGATSAQMKLYDQAAQEMGRTTEYSASQAAEAIKLMASAKPELLSTSAGLTAATKSALTLAQAAGTTLPDATRTLALSLNQFGAGASEADRYINVLAAGAKFGSSEIADTAAAIKNGGVAAAQAGVGFETLNAAIQVLAEREVKGGEAGTALRNVILNLEKGTDKTLKPSVVGLSQALENLAGKNLSTRQAVKLFGVENLSAASILVQNREKVESLTAALTGTQTAHEQAEIRVNNLNGDLLSLTSAFEGLIIKVGQSGNGPLRSGVQTVTDAINGLTDNFNTVDFQITATPRQAVYDPTVQYEFWFTDTQVADIRQVESDARYLGTALYWIAASSGIKPGKDYYFYIRAVNQVGKSAFVEAKGQASNDAAGYLDFFKGEITESHLGKELLEKVELTEDNASRLDEFSKEWQDANGKWNAMWGVKIEQTEDGKHYVAGLGLSMEDTEEGKVSQFLVAADRIAFINPANGNETPAFVMQGDQIFMNEVFLKYLTAPSITSGGNPPTFTLTPDGRLTARNADISGHISANSGALNNVTIEENCTIKGTLRAERILGDIVKAAGREFPYFVISNTGEKRYANGTLTVVIDDDQSFDRQVSIPAITFLGAAYDSQTSNDVWDACTLIVRKNGVEIYNQTSIGVPAVFSRTLDMPAGSGRMTLSFSVSTRGNGSGWPYSRISDLLVIVTKKSSAGITIS
ncbi:phage tail tape measure protein [Citrobacter freundii]|nr:phage tail tape measure protein [Citrobacter freundii]MDE9727339.1 phage tail tape measure protein [Citrobacter freundii]